MRRKNGMANGSHAWHIDDAIFVKPVGDVECRRIRYEEILFIVACGARSDIHTVDSSKVITVAHNIGYLEVKLAFMGIVRTNRSEMVNIRHVDKYINSALFLDHESQRIFTVTEPYRESVFSMFDVL
jgi:DNA-binding LytR/AlgR family response regulator